MTLQMGKEFAFLYGCKVVLPIAPDATIPKPGILKAGLK